VIECSNVLEEYTGFIFRVAGLVCVDAGSDPEQKFVSCVKWSKVQRVGKGG
jgi:hypothetical protein